MLGRDVAAVFAFVMAHVLCSDRRMSLRLNAVKAKMQSILVNGVSGQVYA